MSLSWESVLPWFSFYWGDLLHGKGFNNVACPIKRGFMGTPDLILFGGSEFRQSKVLRCKTLVRTTCGAALLRRKATGAASID